MSFCKTGLPISIIGTCDRFFCRTNIYPADFLWRFNRLIKKDAYFLNLPYDPGLPLNLGSWSPLLFLVLHTNEFFHALLMNV